MTHPVVRASAVNMWLFLTLFVASLHEFSHAASNSIQPSHSSGIVFATNFTVGNTIDSYRILNSGVLTQESSTSVVLRYLGPSHGGPEVERRRRRDADTPVGAVFKNFGNNTPLGNYHGSTSIHMPSFTDGDFSFANGTYVAPYHGVFFFLVHGPIFSYNDPTTIITANLGVTDPGGVRTSEVDIAVTRNSFGVLPVVLALSPRDKVDVLLTGAPGNKMELASIFNVFDLYHFNVIPTQTCFPHLTRQSAFTVIWRDYTIPAAGLLGEFQFRNYFITITNVGSNFDDASGTYTAELPGLYAFFLSFRVSEMPNPTIISITRNDELVASARAETLVNNVRERASTAIVIQLNPGDEVKLLKAASTSPITADGDTLLVFSGFLL